MSHLQAPTQKEEENYNKRFSLVVVHIGPRNGNVFNGKENIENYFKYYHKREIVFISCYFRGTNGTNRYNVQETKY
jgi:hypothetical protein